MILCSQELFVCHSSFPHSMSETTGGQQKWRIVELSAWCGSRTLKNAAQFSWWAVLCWRSVSLSKQELSQETKLFIYWCIWVMTNRTGLWAHTRDKWMSSANTEELGLERPAARPQLKWLKNPMRMSPGCLRSKVHLGNWRLNLEVSRGTVSGLMIPQNEPECWVGTGMSGFSSWAWYHITSFRRIKTDAWINISASNWSYVAQNWYELQI